jgi:outer membrane protein OmpA-like peptidoglycan-associated protein
LLPPPLNSEDTQGALSLTHDGRYLLFAGCQWSDGYGSCDIYAVKTVGKNIGKPQNLGHTLNSTAWDSQPCLAPDGRTLYFSSTRKGGYGKSDIWRSYLQDNGEWSTPENLGETINTYGSEMSPYIHADGKTLYFSSDRHPGMGGMDLFVAKMDSAGNWEKPVNLGYPINTSGDEINIIVNARGDKAYISARLPEGNGGFDIYEFEVYPEIRPKPSTYVKGIVVDAKTNNPLLSYFTLTEINAGKDIITSFSDEKTGEFLLCLPINRDYALNVSREGYLFHSEHFSLTDYKEVFEPYLLNIALNPIIPGEVTIMRNIFFDSGKANLKDESLAELNKLYEFLIQNPSIAVEISGHTDDVGSEDYNMTLSDQRAQAVTDFLVAKGIDSNRLQHKGYGFTKPLTTNQTQEGRAKNRRTEIKVIEMPK